MSVDNSDFRKFDTAQVDVVVTNIPSRGGHHKDMILEGDAYRQNIVSRAFKSLHNVVLNPKDYDIVNLRIRYNEKLDVAEYTVTFANVNI